MPSPMEEQVRLELTRQLSPANGLAIRRSTNYAYCSMSSRALDPAAKTFSADRSSQLMDPRLTAVAESAGLEPTARCLTGRRSTN